MLPNRPARLQRPRTGSTGCIRDCALRGEGPAGPSIRLAFPPASCRLYASISTAISHCKMACATLKSRSYYSQVLWLEKHEGLCVNHEEKRSMHKFIDAKERRKAPDHQNAGQRYCYCVRAVPECCTMAFPSTKLLQMSIRSLLRCDRSTEFLSGYRLLRLDCDTESWFMQRVPPL